MCKLLWPHTTVKLHKIEQVIDHYEPDIQGLDDNIISLALEREKKKHGIYSIFNMIWLLFFIVLMGYIVVDHKKILIELKMLWEKIKNVK